MAKASHRLTNTRPYWAWGNMKKRCDHPQPADYDNYKGRGITYNPEWAVFANFWKDMGETYKNGLMLDRIDNDKGYSKDNCRWATRTEQNNNTRKNRFVVIDGQRKTLADWSKESPVKSSTIRQRFYVYGWDIKRSLGIEA